MDGFKLSDREFNLIQTELTRESRRFLVKQGHSSVVTELNLRGFDDEIAILSGTTKNVELLETIMSEVGESPEKWLPLFQERRKQ